MYLQLLYEEEVSEQLTSDEKATKLLLRSIKFILGVFNLVNNFIGT